MHQLALLWARSILMSSEQCLNKHMQQFRKKSGKNGTLLGWTLDQSHSQPTMGKLRRLRIKISWNIADNFAQTFIQS
jgi:hypothetical protein